MIFSPSSGSFRQSAIAAAFSFFSLTGLYAAVDGKAHYNTYCGACHAPDGKGAGEGAFPPLANSPWLNGNPDRAIQIVLHGLEGEIHVPTAKNPKASFNLAMPPQGGTLTDPQIVAILNYTRNSWGNKNKPITLKDVVKNRRATEERKVMWKSEEILKLYPIGGKKSPPIQNMLSKVYHGTWKTRPNFSKLKAVAVEEEHDGLISLAKAGKSDGFGIVWEGELPVPSKGSYTFTIDSDDGSAVFIDGKLVAEVKGIGPTGRTKTGKINLTKGLHDIRVEYFENKGLEGISLSWKGPGLKGEQALSSTKPTKNGAKPKKKGPRYPSIPLDPPKGGTAFYRGFIDGSTPRAIGVGYDGGINLAFSSDHMSIPLVWQGRFYDGGRHWTNRGQGNEPPPGEKVIKLTTQHAWGVLDSPSAKWSDSNKAEVKPRFRGYKLRAKDRPVFHYEIGSLKISDSPVPQFDAKGITRTITITAPSAGAPKKLHLLICNGLEVKPTDSKNTYRLGDGMQVEIDSTASHAPLIRNKELILPLHLKPGKNLITLRYQWK
jgi:mono/diheme cytochrome c family protein